MQFIKPGHVTGLVLATATSSWISSIDLEF